MKKGIVNANWLNLRETPGGRVLEVLENGAEVDILSHEGGWFRVSTTQELGYASSRYIRVLPQIVAANEAPSEEPDNQDAEQRLHYGRINTDRLNFRSAPEGHVLCVLERGDVIELIEQKNGWIRSRHEDKEGFLSARYITIENRIPQSNLQNQQVQQAHALGFKIEDKKLYAKDGTRFGRKYAKGFYNYGSTSIADFIESAGELVSDISVSRLRVMNAASDNEGKFESFNTWDNAFLSIGLFQWTAGTGADSGELAALLFEFKNRYPDEFEEFFGRFGLQPHNVKQRTGHAGCGYLNLHGITLVNAKQKAVLRQPQWSYQCWLAGHNRHFQLCQLAHAISRIDVFYQSENRRMNGRLVSDYIRSEYGVAQLLDQHVNRPAHVPRTLLQALEELAGELDINAPQTWSSDDEQKLISRYLQLRENTSMTDAKKRGDSIRSKLEQGLISADRGSFI
ncbi:MAG: hypothetical protein ACI93R_002215 [Flavobacteriales bacterium]|jgi:uncharacterized protein YgiM (DUF1202 family)